jgi:membrane protease subunit HflK
MTDAHQQIQQILRRVPAGITGVLVIILLVLAGTTSWFTVDPEEKAVVLRFGEINRTVGQGFQFKWPFGFEKEYKVPVLRQLKVEFGFRTNPPSTSNRAEYSLYNTSNYDAESLMLTGDLNIADIEWVTQFTIVDPEMYLFRYRVHNRRKNEAIDTFRDMNEAVMRQVVGDHTINEVLTTGRSSIQSEVMQKLQSLCTEYELGIRVDQVILQDINPPESVKPAFNEVNEAEQEKDTSIEKARAEYNKVIPRASGEAKKSIESAEGYREKRINEAEGSATAFKAVFEAYQKAPEVTRKRMYLETMEEVLGRAGKKTIIDNDLSGILPLLNLDDVK